MTEAERRAALEEVAAEVRACTRCRLHEGRTSAVPGEGHPSTEVLLVGEGPGLNEDRQGRPFVGAAGGFLDELLGTIGWSREEVFITNVVKCRPPQNRDPEPDEIAACAPFLRRQAEILDPALVVTLGRHSMGRFMPGARIGQVHGTTAPAPADTGAAGALVFAMYHPAAALHQGTLRQTLLDDMTGVPRALLEARRRRGDRSGAADAAAAQPEPPIEPALEPEPEPRTQPDSPIEAATPEPGRPIEAEPPVALQPAELDARSAVAARVEAGVTVASAPDRETEEPPVVAVELVAVQAGQAGLPPDLVLAADPSATDQMTLF